MHVFYSDFITFNNRCFIIIFINYYSIGYIMNLIFKYYFYIKYFTDDFILINIKL